MIFVEKFKTEYTFSSDIDMAFEIDVINKHKCHKIFSI